MGKRPLSRSAPLPRAPSFAPRWQLEPDLKHGAALFSTCAACHQADGCGTDDASVPAIAGQHVSVLVKQLVDFRADRRWDERMQNFASRHTLTGPQDLLDVASYIESLPRWPPLEGGIGDGAALQLGASVYFRQCESCHGPLGRGRTAPHAPTARGPALRVSSASARRDCRRPTTGYGRSARDADSRPVGRGAPWCCGLSVTPQSRSGFGPTRSLNATISSAYAREWCLVGYGLQCLSVRLLELVDAFLEQLICRVGEIDAGLLQIDGHLPGFLDVLFQRRRGLAVVRKGLDGLARERRSRSAVRSTARRT